MRSDLNKVVTERPRRGGGGPSQPKGYRKNTDLSEDAPKREKIRRKWIEDWNEGKEFSDVLGPLNRWLHSKIGCNWDDIYSEISTTLKKTSKTMLHIYTHIFQFVETKVRIIDGVAYHHNWDFPIKSYGNYYNFYVHPETNVLCLAPKNKKKKWKNKGPQAIKIDGQFYLKIDNIWYKVETKKFEPTKYLDTTYSGFKVYRDHYYAYDPVIKQTFTSQWYAREMYGECVIGVSKQQLNKKEIKKLDLK